MGDVVGVKYKIELSHVLNKVLSKGIITSSLSMSLLMGCSDTSIDTVQVEQVAKPAFTKKMTELSQSQVNQALADKPSVEQGSPLIYFSNPQSASQLIVENGTTSIKKIDNETALEITLETKQNHTAQFSFVPAKPLDWSHEGDFGFAVDLINPKPNSINVYVTAKDSKGHAHNRTFVIPANSDDSYYMVLKDADLNIETGIRSNPQHWETNMTEMIWRHGVKNIDLKNVAEIEFKVRGVPEDKTLFVKNLRLVKPLKFKTDYLTHLVDKFGQSTKINFSNKVSSVAQLREISAAEQASLSQVPPQGRSKFNGWKDGPKLQATGYFRTEKYQGKWSLVDPEGYLFFSNGIANIRMANTSTLTGYDFDSQYIVQRDPNDHTPEDSIGLNRAPKKAWTSRHISSDIRAKMFSDLPSYDEPMGSHFGYRREVHSGAVEKGETYSFYQANLARKYESNYLAEYTQKWRDTTIDRMLSWGFTSFGNWVDASFYQLDRIPYFANGWIIGDFKTVSSGNDYWSPMPDPFDPLFKERAVATAKQIADEVKNNPWCVGVFIDNEKSWGVEGSIKGHYGIAINTLKLAASDSPTKTEFVKVLKAKYSSVDALNNKWKTQIASWDDLDKGVELSNFNDAVVADLSILLEHYGEQYFSIVKNAVKTYLPNHLYLGVRFTDWGMTPEIRAAAAKHADVMSYNYYKESVNDSFWSFLEDIDMPSIIGEFHNGALDSGLLNPGLIHASSQQDRGDKYQQYVYSVIDNPYFVGTHWFQYIDSPLTGRAYDGENYNVGFVSVTDIPYKPLVDAAKQVNSDIYTRRFGKVKGIESINDK
ncbi:beta-galactosidase [Shewanella donghaensis]|uniref:beta-galactosidase n=1 Tax=Shewanella donghaensis TaxID=238836 RepID=UPI001D04E976|nr:beta-galactosidase [Shewanella donghaensis]